MKTSLIQFLFTFLLTVALGNLIKVSDTKEYSFLDADAQIEIQEEFNDIELLIDSNHFNDLGIFKHQFRYSISPYLGVSIRYFNLTKTLRCFLYILYQSLKLDC